MRILLKFPNNRLCGIPLQWAFMVERKSMIEAMMKMVGYLQYMYHDPWGLLIEGYLKTSQQIMGSTGLPFQRFPINDYINGNGLLSWISMFHGKKC